MGYWICHLWISNGSGRLRQTLAVSPVVPADWRGLDRCSRPNVKPFMKGFTIYIGLSTS